jgi:hypothetical protein
MSGSDSTSRDAGSTSFGNVPSDDVTFTDEFEWNDGDQIDVNYTSDYLDTTPIHDMPAGVSATSATFRWSLDVQLERRP